MDLSEHEKMPVNRNCEYNRTHQQREDYLVFTEFFHLPTVLTLKEPACLQSAPTPRLPGSVIL